jgi:2-dehydropantoate 2-reductase
MRFLVLGAGGVGGYFGARLVERGADVTFLVRPTRAAQIAKSGLVLLSPRGDYQGPVRISSTDDVRPTYDAVLLACKAYDLAPAIDALAGAIGPRTMVMPLLNGIAHYDTLVARFGSERVLGGIAHLAATLSPEGHILHLNEMHLFTFGELAGGRSCRMDRLHAAIVGANADIVYSENVMHAAWDKWVMLATLAGMTCLMRAAVGGICATSEGETITREFYSECCAIADAARFPISPEQQSAALELLTRKNSTFCASMLRDIESGRPTEGTHVLGDMLARARRFSIATPTLKLAYAHVEAYEARRSADARRVLP